MLRILVIWSKMVLLDGVAIESLVAIKVLQTLGPSPVVKCIVHYTHWSLYENIEIIDLVL